jgi:hypothetical protein
VTMDAEPDAQPPEFDAQLAACFAHEHGAPPMDPFVGRVARRIATARRRRRYLKLAAQVAGVAVLMLCSHWLIETSVIASAKLDSWFAVGLQWLATPLGTSALLACGVGTAAALRRWGRRGRVARP